MADQFASLEEAARAARLAQAFIQQAQALLSPANGDVMFACVNAPYRELFGMKLPRTVWEPELLKQIAAQQAIVDAATGAATDNATGVSSAV